MEWQHESAPGMDNPVALVQVASEDVCLIFYMLQLGSMPPALEELLLDKHFLKVGLAVTNDLRKLHSQFFLIPRGLLDVATMARRLSYTRLGLQSLAQDLLGKHLSYAATDAFTTLLIYKQLKAIEVAECQGHYWTMVLADDEAAMEAELNAVGPRIRELKESMQKLTRHNTNLAAQLATVKAEAQRTKAAYEAKAQRTRAAFQAEAQRTRAAFQAEVQRTRDAFEDRIAEIEEHLFW
ncbi:3'5' exonuclease domain containing protein [Acanthamoeba castellanii str. Neff]|uniref:3'5' exonuclease domain containing protein n=1 Tax=Acanthamoeba castellanii (strain ATCC 30010 / Neff) TaxID=1257118 RepID=L8H2T0_ACACF|nr:3'5' exonuclease domain containing protein [Acanthamoeba castellanii str. Neff]ELR18691.1 3'5' exonuclease domain containing protein [Acanthamoeba castellanii str. Neff]